VRGYFAKSSVGANCVGFTKILTTEWLVERCAVFKQAM
jgi:hypothetical protein